MNFTRCNITEVVQKTHLRFTSLAKQKGLDLTLKIPERACYAHVNKEAFTKILSNLLSNAMKYAESYVQIFLETDMAVENGIFHIRTVNDGPIVPDTMKEEIFKPFVRFNGEENGKVTSGTGIGLALSRSLAELHRGSLRMVEGEDANIFCLTLPLTQDNAITMESGDVSNVEPSAELQAKWEELKENNENRYTVLVVEDNPEMLSFVSRQLSHEYIVLTAVNGEEALRILDENFVNLIVSDVVMPLMDGFELCKTVKSKLDYSHIPIILLTAKTNLESKTEGMENGAEVYMEKPFSIKQLHNQIENLLKLRLAFHELMLRSAGTTHETPISEYIQSECDITFMKEVDTALTKHLDEESFSVDNLADAMNMSRTNFYRKLKMLTGMAPNIYIKNFRLNQAAELLAQNMRINEVMLRVGFMAPSYFAKCFKAKFGKLPKEYQNTINKQE